MWKKTTTVLTIALIGLALIAFALIDNLSVKPVPNVYAQATGPAATLQPTHTFTPPPTATFTPLPTATPCGLVSLAPSTMVVSESSGTVTLNLSLDRPQGVSVNVTLGSAIIPPDYATAFVDYGTISPVTFQPSEMSKQITIPIIQDIQTEPSESFNVSILSTAGGCVTISSTTSQSQIVILDDDFPTSTPLPTDTPAPTDTDVPIPTDTNTPIPTNTDTPVPTDTSAPVPTGTDTPVPANTDTPVPANTATSVPADADTPVPANTATSVPADTDTPIPANTATSVPADTDTPVPANTATPVPANTDTPVPADTDTPVPANTATPVPANTDTPVPADTDTPVPANTDTPVPANTDTPVPADTDTPIPADTDTPVPANTDTPVPADTDTPVPVNTDTPVPAGTDTPIPPTATAIPATEVPTDTPTPVATDVPPTATPFSPVGGVNLLIGEDDELNPGADVSLVVRLGDVNAGSAVFTYIVFDFDPPDWVFSGFLFQNSADGSLVFFNVPSGVSAASIRQEERTPCTAESTGCALAFNELAVETQSDFIENGVIVETQLSEDVVDGDILNVGATLEDESFTILSSSDSGLNQTQADEALTVGVPVSDQGVALEPAEPTAPTSATETEEPVNRIFLPLISR